MQLGQDDAAIRERAYAIWEAEGRPEGHDWDHWYRAMQESSRPAAPNGATRAARSKAKPSRKSGRFLELLRSALSP